LLVLNYYHHLLPEMLSLYLHLYLLQIHKLVVGLNFIDIFYRFKALW